MKRSAEDRFRWRHNVAANHRVEDDRWWQRWNFIGHQSENNSVAKTKSYAFQQKKNFHIHTYISNNWICNLSRLRFQPNENIDFKMNINSTNWHMQIDSSTYIYWKKLDKNSSSSSFKSLTPVSSTEQMRFIITWQITAAAVGTTNCGQVKPLYISIIRVLQEMKLQSNLR